jgi:hypothetical protein
MTPSINALENTYLYAHQRDTKVALWLKPICQVVVVTYKRFKFIKLIPSVDRPHSHIKKFPLRASDGTIRCTDCGCKTSVTNHSKRGFDHDVDSIISLAVNIY